MDYVTLAEAAELEGLKYDAIQKKIRRGQADYITEIKKSDSGGRDIVLIAVTSLSKQARAAWKERQKLKELAESEPEQMEESTQQDKPWYVDADLDWYIENYKERYYQGVELGNIVRDFLQYGEKDRTLYAETYAQEKLGKSARTLYRFVKSYLEAAAWADKLQKETGAGYDYFKVLCLCRKPKDTGTFPSMTQEIKQTVKNIWFHEDFALNQNTKEKLYEYLKKVASINGWEKVPSYQTICRYTDYLMNEEHMKSAHYMVQKGTREWRNAMMVKGRRDTKGIQVMEIVMGDEHTFDCWVSYKLSNGKVIAIKPKLVAWVDMRSRAIFGDVVCKDGNSDILKQSLLNMIYKEEVGGVCKYLYIDNGKDYTAETMTGRKRNDRAGIDFDEETKGFYRSIGIIDDHRALPYQPWSKAQMERFFGTVCSQFTKTMRSYTGTLTGSKTGAKVEKDIKEMLKRGELLTLEEFYRKWHTWLTEVYMHNPHAGLKKAGEKYRTPYEVFMKEDRYFKAAPAKSVATILMMKDTDALVRNIGIVKNGYEYRSDVLCDYIGKKVDIKYDPEDMATLYVFYKGEKICEAHSQELLQIAPKVKQKALEEHLQMQKRHEKRTKQYIEEARKSLKEINEEYVDVDTIMDEMMIGNKPQKAKIVAMPEERTTRSSIKSKNEQREESAYLAAQAEEAMRKIRAINE